MNQVLKMSEEKPRLKYSDVFKLPDFSSLKDGDILSLCDNPVEYAGHHFDSIVWLRIGREVYAFDPKDLAGKLKLPDWEADVEFLNLLEDWLSQERVLTTEQLAKLNEIWEKVLNHVEICIKEAP